MSNDPPANMARLAALCDDLCETESATVDRRQLCEWLSAMGVMAYDRDAALARATAAEAERDALREALADFVAMGEQYGWDTATTGRELLMRAARAALGVQP